MVVCGAVVAWLGSDDVGRSQFPDVDVEDLDGEFVVSGFVDSHIHLSAACLMLSGLDLRLAVARPHCIQMVADYAVAYPNQPVWGTGGTNRRGPDHAAPSTNDLDAVRGEGPVYLACVDVHFGLTSTGLPRLVPKVAVAMAGFAAQLPLTGDTHHLAWATSRDLLAAPQLAEDRTATLKQRPPQPALSQCMNASSPTLAGSMTGYRFASSTMVSKLLVTGASW